MIYSLIPKVENAIAFKFVKPLSEHRLENNEWYHKPAWTKLSYKKRCANPNCERCEEQGIITPANLVHHIQPIQGATSIEEKESLMFDWDNLMSVCFKCHSLIHNTLDNNTEGGV